MTNKVVGGGTIDGALGVNPDFSEIEAGLGRVVQSIDENGTVFYWLVESTSKGGWLLANGLYANPTKVVGDSLPIIAGSFVDGFTLTKPNQVGIDSSGDEWKYIGDDSLPVVVAPNTDPSASGDFKKLGKPSNDDYLNLKIFQSPTDGGLTEIQTRTVASGEVYEVRKTSDDSLATIYSDAAGTTEIVQNGTDNKSGSDGVVGFYIADGAYYVEVGGVKSNFTDIVKATNVETSDGRNVQERLDDLPSEVDAAGTAVSLIAQHNSDATAHPELSAFITAEADRAETAAGVAMTAGWVYANASDGEEVRVNGDYFWVVSQQSDEVLELWLMGASNATNTGKTVNSSDYDFNRLTTATKNILIDNFVDYAVGVSGNNAYLMNTITGAKSVMFPIISGVEYTVKIHDPTLSNAFNLAVNSTIPTFSGVTSVLLDEMVFSEATTKQHTFTASISGFAFLYVSDESKEPRVQAEVGANATDYVNPFEIDEKYINTYLKNIEQEILTVESKIPVDTLVSTRNIFQYYTNLTIGASGGNAFAINTNPDARTAVFPVEAGKSYSVNVFDTDVKDSFNIAVNSTIPVFSGVSTVALDKLVYAELTAIGHTFTSTITGFAFVYTSATGKEPRIMCEEGITPTNYTGAESVDPKFTGDLNHAGLLSESSAHTLSLITEQSRNLCDNKFIRVAAGGTPGTYAQVVGDVNARSVYAKIETGKSYTVKKHGNSDAFRVATAVELPDIKNQGQVQVIESLLFYNDALDEFTFTAQSNSYLIVTVSSSGQEPNVQIERFSVATDFVENKVIKSSAVNGAIESNKAVISSKAGVESLTEQNLNSIDLPCCIKNEVFDPADPNERFVDYFDDKMWGYKPLTKTISYSIDDGLTWIEYTSVDGVISKFMMRLMPCNDGEVLFLTEDAVYKSSGWAAGSPTWSSSKITITPGAVLFQFGADGDGSKFIIVEYGAGTANWQHSRKGWISTDGGDTFVERWDSLAKHGALTNSETHLHAACYDKFSDRFYLTEGHGPKGGLWCSTNNGFTWFQAKGYRDGVLASANVWPKEGDTNGPTVVVATPTGLVLGSDQKNNGMFGMVRKENPLDEVVTRTYAAKDYDGLVGVSMFAIRGKLDEETGNAYIAFRSERNNVPPIICCGKPTSANLIYEYPNLPVQGASDLFGAIARTASKKIVAYGQFGGNPYTFRGDIEYNASGIIDVIQTELRKAGLIS